MVVKSRNSERVWSGPWKDGKHAKAMMCDYTGKAQPYVACCADIVKM